MEPGDDVTDEVLRHPLDVGLPEYAPDPDAMAALAERNGEGSAILPVPIEWHELFTKDRAPADWLIEGIWPRGRMISLTAPRKARKSLLMLYLAARLAIGRCPWTDRRMEPVRVAYLDYEMTEDDVLERLEDMRLGPDDLANLRYFLHPTLPMLDTPEGGRALLGVMAAHDPAAIVIDTYSRVVTTRDNTGHETREFYRWSAQHVKARGCSIARLDHTGHGDQTRAAGTAAKGTDVDVGWVIHPGDAHSMSLRHHGLTRMSWVPEKLDLTWTDEPLAFRRAARAYIEGTAECAADLDRLGISRNVSGNEAQRLLREAGRGRNRRVVLDAVSYRQETP